MRRERESIRKQQFLPFSCLSLRQPPPCAVHFALCTVHCALWMCSVHCAVSVVEALPVINIIPALSLFFLTVPACTDNCSCLCWSLKWNCTEQLWALLTEQSLVSSIKQENSQHGTFHCTASWCPAYPAAAATTRPVLTNCCFESRLRMHSCSLTGGWTGCLLQKLQWESVPKMVMTISTVMTAIEEVITGTTARLGERSACESQKEQQCLQQRHRL